MQGIEASCSCLVYGGECVVKPFTLPGLALLQDDTVPSAGAWRDKQSILMQTYATGNTNSWSPSATQRATSHGTTSHQLLITCLASTASN